MGSLAIAEMVRQYFSSDRRKVFVNPASLVEAVARLEGDYVRRLAIQELAIGIEEKKIFELEAILARIDRVIGPADATCEVPGLMLSEAVRMWLVEEAAEGIVDEGEEGKISAVERADVRWFLGQLGLDGGEE